MSEATRPCDTSNRAVEYHNISASGNSRVHNGNVIYQGTASPSLREQCLQSLAFPDMMQRRDGIAAKTDDTCEWILEHDQYTDWCREGGLLWVKGRAGTGKSTLMRSILRHTEQHANDHSLVLWYFFHKRGSPLQFSVLGLQRSLLHQILSRHERLLDNFIKESDFEKRCKNEGKFGEGWNWTESDLWEHLTRIIHLCAAEQTLALYIDALDEAGEAVARDLMLRLGNLRAKVGSRLKTCISCRPYPDVIWKSDYIIAVETYNHQDIAAYLDAEFDNATGWGSQDDMDAIKASLLSRASGVFQWIVLVTRRILHLRKESIALIMDEIKRVPEELGDLYESVLGQLSATDQNIALSLLRWVTFAARPLTIAELRYAVTIDPTVPLHSTLDCHKSSHWCGNDSEMYQRLLRLSRGLVRFVEAAIGLPVVEFDHESVQEYMLERGIAFLGRQEPDYSAVSFFGRQHHFLSTCCVRLLAASDMLSIERSRLEYPFFEHSAFPFLHYAVPHWTDHAVLAELSGVSQADLMDITEWPAFGVWTHWHSTERKIYPPHPERTTLQHIAAQYGLVSILQKLIPRSKRNKFAFLTRGLLPTTWRPDSIEAVDSLGMTPLLVAAYHGQESVVKLLLSIGQVKVVSRCFSKFRRGDTTLAKATKSEHTEPAEPFLQRQKVNINCRDWNGRTPLMMAAAEGHEEIFRLLLDADKTQPDAKDENGKTVLLMAVQRGNSAIVKLLLETHQVDVDARDGMDKTPLWWAVYGGHQDVAKLLLLHCNDLTIDQKDCQGYTPLSLAAVNGLKTLVQLLLDTGKVDIDSQTICRQTPLLFAAEGGHIEIVKIFLESKQVNVNQRNKDRNNTPLTLAAANGCEGVVSILIADSRVEVNARDIDGMTPLSLAAEHGHEGTVKLLLDSGLVDLSSRDRWESWTALEWAMEYGRTWAEEEGSFNTAKLLEQYTVP